MNTKLTIAVITMNRADQLKEALESCLACRLPEKTEFVIIDNASTDHTQQVVAQVMEGCGYDHYYERMAENLGVGGGRNCAVSKAKGEFVYLLDDDAVIDTDKNLDFFAEAIRIFEENPKIMTITTQCYDIVWGKHRMSEGGSKLADGIYTISTFCGGSHFLRKAFFGDAPYLPNKYGYEEIPPSLRVIDAGLYNVFAANLSITHKPKVNKWDWTDEKNHALLANECAVPYAIKKMMYPGVFQPLVFLAYTARVHKYLGKYPQAAKKCRQLVGETMEKYKLDQRIKVKTVVKMCKDFGLAIF